MSATYEMRCQTLAAFSLIICAASTACADARITSAELRGDSLLLPVELPTGFEERMTDSGPVFTDERGMTLYLRKGGPCKVKYDPPDEGVNNLYKIYAEYPAPTCVKQWPPLLAAAGAKARGDWTIVTRPEGTRQWAYQGHPVHLSYKDRLPGDANGVTSTVFGMGDWSFAQAPLRLPPGVTAKLQRGVGLMATTVAGESLYTVKSAEMDHKSSARNDDSAKFRRISLPLETAQSCGKACMDAEKANWNALPAARLASGVGPWSVFSSPEGIKSWAYKGRAIYTYREDHSVGDENGVGIDNAQLVVLWAAPKAPSGITVERSLIGPVFADANGMTLYVFTCSGVTPGGNGDTGRYSCDGPADDLSFNEQFCAAADKCGAMWRPLQAPADTNPHGGTWSVAVIPDPDRYPLRWVPVKAQERLAPGAIKVWTYQGRPIYTSVLDPAPAELFGHNLGDFGGPNWTALLAGEVEGE